MDRRDNGFCLLSRCSVMLAYGFVSKFRAANDDLINSDSIKVGCSFCLSFMFGSVFFYF